MHARRTALTHALTHARTHGSTQCVKVGETDGGDAVEMQLSDYADYAQDQVLACVV